MVHRRATEESDLWFEVRLFALIHLSSSYLLTA